MDLVDINDRIFYQDAMLEADIPVAMPRLPWRHHFRDDVFFKITNVY